MKLLRLLVSLSVLAAVSGPVAAQEAVPWNAPAHIIQFKYLQETKLQSREAWNRLSPEERLSELAAVKDPAADRHARITGYYDGAMRQWDTESLRRHQDTIKEKDIRDVSFWLGQEQGERLSRKLAATRALVRKAGEEGLDDQDVGTLEAYLTPGAIADLKAEKAAQAATHAPKADPGGGTLEPQSLAGAGLAGFAADPSALNMDALDKFYNGRVSRGALEISGGPRGGDRNYGAAAVPGAAIAPVTAARAAAPGVPLPAPAGAGADEKRASGLTSDAYGVTVYVAGGAKPLTFRQGKAAEDAIRRLPDGSISKIVFYGHGAPGLQSVGDYDVVPEVAAFVLKGKMAPRGVIQFEGCNTSGIGDKTSFNPLYGLSAGMRRLLYFSLPYFQDRLHGVPAAAARKTWEAEWNKDLARDTSVSLSGSVVCGNRTFGLVPGRLPVVTAIMGNQQATTPGYVLAKKACYLNGEEVKAP